MTPEDCPEPFWHKTHHYCPCCSWQSADAPGSPEASEIDALRARLAAAYEDAHTAQYDRDCEFTRANEAERKLAAAEAVMDAGWDVIALKHGSIPLLKKRLLAYGAQLTL